jgi:hypothetical protein
MAISFTGSSKLVTLSSGTTSLDVRDLWSRWVDWFLTSDNSKYPMAMATLGGDDINPAEGTTVPIYAFLLNGWKIRPQEADHTLGVVNGILLVSGGGDPFVNPVGDFAVRINYQQPVQAISYSADGGAGVDPSVIAAAVLDALLSGHVLAGSMGKTIADIHMTVQDNQALILSR